MVMPIASIPDPNSAGRSQLLAVNEIRNRVLECLYARRVAIEDLIRSLENYQKSKPAAMAQRLSMARRSRANESPARGWGVGTGPNLRRVP